MTSPLRRDEPVAECFIDVWMIARILRQAQDARQATGRSCESEDATGPSDATLMFITMGNGLIGTWLLVTAALVLAASALPSALGWFGVAGGAGLAFTSFEFSVLGREHPIIAVAGLVALIGLVGFYGWVGLLLVRARVEAG